MDYDRIERRLKLHDVRALLTVAEAGGMGRAAELLGTSQPAVSRSISELENALGVRLLDRGPHGIQPTHYGRALMKRAVAVFDELRQGVKDIEFLADPTAGELRIGASLVIASGFAAAVIDRLARQYPRIVFHLTAGEASLMYRALADRKLDLMVARLFAPIHEEDMHAEPLYGEPHVVAAGASNPWTKKREIALADLLNEPWVLPPADTLYGSLFIEAFRAVGLHCPRPAVVTYSNPVRSALVANGHFLTIVPESVVRFPRTDLALRKLPIDLPTMKRPIGIVTLKSRTIAPVARLFIDYARAVAAELADGKPPPNRAAQNRRRK